MECLWKKRRYLHILALLTWTGLLVAFLKFPRGTIARWPSVLRHRLVASSGSFAKPRVARHWTCAPRTPSTPASMHGLRFWHCNTGRESGCEDTKFKNWSIEPSRVKSALTECYQVWPGPAVEPKPDLGRCVWPWLNFHLGWQRLTTTWRRSGGVAPKPQLALLLLSAYKLSVAPHSRKTRPGQRAERLRCSASSVRNSCE